jgi:hypothetical protein
MDKDARLLFRFGGSRLWILTVKSDRRASCCQQKASQPEK